MTAIKLINVVTDILQHVALTHAEYRVGGIIATQCAVPVPVQKWAATALLNVCVPKCSVIQPNNIDDVFLSTRQMFSSSGKCATHKTPISHK